MHTYVLLPFLAKATGRGTNCGDMVVSTTTRHLRVYTIQYFSKMGGEGRIIRLNLGCGEC
jgi:hypothetical protein